MNSKSLLLSALAGIVAISATHADVTVNITGSTAFRAIMYDRIAGILSGETTVNVAGNSNIRTFKNGTIPTYKGTNYASLGNVTFQCGMSGSSAGIAAVADQTDISVTQDGTTFFNVKPHVTMADTYLSTVGRSESAFNRTTVGVVPFVFFTSADTRVAGVTNFTQQQVTYLFSASGFVPINFVGGSSSDLLLLVGRDSGSGTRAQIEKCTIYSGSMNNFWTNRTTGAVELHPDGGFASGSLIGPDVDAIGNAFGYSSLPDAGARRQIAYEGVSYSSNNVVTGKYPIWGYEHVVTKKSGTGAPTANEAIVIAILADAIKDTAYQTGNSAYYNSFTPLSTMQVERSADGGPISNPTF